MQLGDLQTPSLVLDESILKRNLHRMSQVMHHHGVSLRPHLKTAKSADVGRLAVDGEAGGITVSTVAEAAYFAQRGFRDITLAVAITPEKLHRVSVLISRDVNLNVRTDDRSLAREIANER